MSEAFGYRLQLDRIHDGERLDLIANDGERHAIRERLDLVSLSRLEAHAMLDREGDEVRVSGRVQAALEQSCSVTGEPVPAHIDEAFELLFRPQPKPGDTPEEIELSEGECDVVFHDGAVIELGAAVVDTLALSLDPYPRSAGADAALKEAGVLSEEQAGPFAALAKLKRADSGEA